MPYTDLNSTTHPWRLGWGSTTISSMILEYRTLYVSLMCLQALEGVLILAVNSVTVMTLVRIPSLRTLSSYFIINLSLADLISCLLPLLSVIRYNLTRESSPWSYICFLEKLILMGCLLGNMTFALGVTVDRYLYMAYPLRYEVLVTGTRVRVIIIGIWLVIVSQGLITGVLSHMASTAECHYNGMLLWGPFYFVVVADFCLCFLFSLTVLGRYLLMSWKQQHQTSAWMGSVAVAGTENKDMTNMIIGVVFIHVACFTPSFIVGAFLGLAQPSPALLILDSAAATVMLVNSWVKPFVYFGRNKLYRNAYKENYKDICKGYFSPRPTPPRVITAPP